jgi:hypothetical protein
MLGSLQSQAACADIHSPTRRETPVQPAHRIVIILTVLWLCTITANFTGFCNNAIGYPNLFLMSFTICDLLVSLWLFLFPGKPLLPYWHSDKGCQNQSGFSDREKDHHITAKSQVLVLQFIIILRYLLSHNTLPFPPRPFILNTVFPSAPH